MNELTPTEANRLFYASHAEEYDAIEFCANAPRARLRLKSALDRALDRLSPDARILDAGGGSGNASELMYERGYRPVLVDVSTEMVALWQQKAQSLGFDPHIEVAALEDFFARDGRRWDLITFSSVLHHLEDPIGLLRAAGERLEPGGFIVTVFDPVDLGRRGVALRRADYLGWVLTRSPRRVPELIARRLRPSADRSADDNVGAIAEYHAMSGLDDRAIVGAARADGLTVVSHERTYDARFAVVRAAARMMRLPTSFSLVLRKPKT